MLIGMFFRACLGKFRRQLLFFDSRQRLWRSRLLPKQLGIAVDVPHRLLCIVLLSICAFLLDHELQPASAVVRVFSVFVPLAA